jgi:MFS family permease
VSTAESGVTRRERLPLWALLGANAISQTGNNLTLLAVPWFVLATTGSAARTGVTLFFTILPAVLASFFGGALVDRLGHKRASVLADVASGATVALIPALWAAGLLPFWLLLTLVFLGALLDAPGQTARDALVPDLAARACMPIERVTSLLQVVERGSRLVGAPLGGVLIAALGPTNALYVDAASFAVSAALVGVAVTVPRAALDEEERAGYVAQLLEGLRFIRRDALLLALVGTLTVTNLLDAAKTVAMPVYADRVYGSAVALGLLFGASGGGAVVGALVYGALGPRLPRRPVFIVCFVVVSLSPLALAALPSLSVALLIQALSGLAAGPLNPILGAVMYERVPARMRGRVFGVLTAGAYAAMPLGVLVSGYALDAAGLRPTLLVVGGCYLATTLSLLVNRALRRMDVPAAARRPVEAAP